MHRSSMIGVRICSMRAILCSASFSRPALRYCHVPLLEGTYVAVRVIGQVQAVAREEGVWQ